MKILIVNIYFHPDPTGTGLVITELARDLVSQGHEVTVITSFPHYGGGPARGARCGMVSGSQCAVRGKDRPPSARRATRRFPSLFRREILDGIGVIRTAVYVPRHPTFWSRALNYATFSVLAITAGLGSGAQDVILCTSPPLSIGVSAWILSRLKRVPFVFNVQDIYPDAAVLMGMVRNPALIALFQRLERFVYRKASLVTVISDGAKQNLLAKGVPAGRLAVIPNWVDVEHVRPVPAENEFRRRIVESTERKGDSAGTDESAPIDLSTLNSRRSTKLVMFAGNIGLIAGLETVLETAAALRHRPDIHFFLIGEGNAKGALEDRARKMGLENVSFLSTQPREILPQVLGAADVHLVTLKQQMSSTSVPSKAYGIMASGRPMVAAVDPGSEIWRLVEAADAGTCVPPEDPSELARAIQLLCDSPEERQRLGENARAYVVRHNAKHELTALYGRTLGDVAAGDSGVPALRRSGVQEAPSEGLNARRSERRNARTPERPTGEAGAE